MGSERAFGLSLRFAVVFAAGAGASAAWQAGYPATLAICALAGLWLAADAALRGGRPTGDGADEAALTSAVLLREREARTLAAYLDHAPVPLLAVEEDALTALNLAARRFFGVDARLPKPPAALVAAVEAAVPGERVTVVLEVEGAPRAYALTIAELTSGGALSRIAALVDVQAEIQAAEAAALRDLVQVLSHEITNSLTPVTSLAQTASELLKSSRSEDLAAARDAVATVARRSDGLLRFMTAYRQLARVPAPRPAETSVAGLVADAVLLFRSRWEASGVRLEVAPTPDFMVRVDRDLIVQALMNLLANAAEAALVGDGPPLVQLSAERTRHDRLAITVEDSGPGIGTADAELLFRPFYTTKAEGTGVGLAVVRQIVLAHGGHVAVEAGERGARFTVLL
jgi:signal transduction histidine kinase